MVFLTATDDEKLLPKNAMVKAEAVAVTPCVAMETTTAASDAMEAKSADGAQGERSEMAAERKQTLAAALTNADSPYSPGAAFASFSKKPDPNSKICFENEVITCWRCWCVYY